MYRILIVEDEDIIRESIANVAMNWGENLAEIREARDGAEGLAVSREFKPHIIITDIKMPKMSGLEMIGEIQKFMSGTKFLILSGYDDFEFAQDAISLKVSAYLLKPFDDDDIVKKLKRMIDELEKERKELVFRERAVRTVNETILNNLLNNLINWTDDINAMLKILQGYDIHFSCDRYYCISMIAVGWDLNKRKDFEERSSDFFKRGLEVAEIHFLRADNGCERLIFILGINGSENINLWLPVIEEYHKYITVRFSFSAVIGVSDRAVPIHRIRESIKEAQIAAEWNFFTKTQKVALYREKYMSKAGSSEIQKPWAELLQDAIMAFKLSNSELVIDKVKRLYEILSSTPNIGMDRVKSLYTRLLTDVLMIASEKSPEMGRELLSRMEKGVQYSLHIGSLHELCCSLLSDAIKVLKEGGDGGTWVVARMKQFIHENYQSGISLSEVAVQMKMSPNYIGTIFNSSEGKTFNSYLAEYRIECAKKLLTGSEASIQEIAEKVGIPDAAYFSTTFKKITGMTPGKYNKAMAALKRS